jgi:uncharacterized damage-inducible protein DinB
VESIEFPERPQPPNHGTEWDQLTSWLDFYRATLLTKCAGLDLEQLTRRPVATSTLSLLGLVRHMTFVEQVWFEFTFANFAAVTYYGRDEHPGADFDDLDSTPLDEVFQNFDTACERSRELSHGHSLDQLAKYPRRGREVDLRWIFIHMIEEYARHCGHADILRELIDGATGY